LALRLTYDLRLRHVLSGKCIAQCQINKAILVFRADGNRYFAQRCIYFIRREVSGCYSEIKHGFLI